ncbi:hypothetical protein GCM10012275_04730 [Longimycelium tulufanense]|uniref:Uncharacterized protein n=1 Tax=Longimycelium tulufanense TaxID=907463 RepID=A0A8J3FT80_9PSEU|nr:hypothetical protein [Longimycelium tulufanense]GGM36599.1 hypothetical protein GCM10012275_04730 [Longimycelium tulufanense]
MPWNYWHRIELFRIDRGRRVLQHSQDVDDHGPYVCRGAEEWARIVTEDHLERWSLPHGRWLVVVWRLDQERSPVAKLCEVRLNWNGRPSESDITDSTRFRGIRG